MVAMDVIAPQIEPKKFSIKPSAKLDGTESKEKLPSKPQKLPNPSYKKLNNSNNSNQS